MKTASWWCQRVRLINRHALDRSEGHSGPFFYFSFFLTSMCRTRNAEVKTTKDSFSYYWIAQLESFEIKVEVAARCMPHATRQQGAPAAPHNAALQDARLAALMYCGDFCSITA